MGDPAHLSPTRYAHVNPYDRCSFEVPAADDPTDPRDHLTA